MVRYEKICVIGIIFYTVYPNELFAWNAKISLVNVKNQQVFILDQSIVRLPYKKHRDAGTERATMIIAEIEIPCKRNLLYPELQRF